MKAFNNETWQQIADYVLAPLVAEQMVDGNTQHYWRGIQNGLMVHQFPDGMWADVYKAVSGLVLQDKPVHITTLQNELNGSVPSEYIAQLYTMYKKGSTLSGHVFDANVESLRELGERHFTIQRLQKATTSLIQGGQDLSQDKVISDTISTLTNSGSNTIKDETAEQMADDFANYMSEAPDNNLLTGIQLVDGWTGGLGLGDFIAIAAPMKQRKTSLVLNMMINMARDGHSVALMMLESNKRMVNAMLVSMFAIEYLLQNGHYDRPELDDNAKMLGQAKHIHASALVRLRGRYPSLGKLRTAAINHGIHELKSIGRNLRIYDRTREGGSLNDNASIHRICLRDKALYNTEFIAIDHAQRVNERGNDYEKLTTVVPYLESLARRENIAMCLLAQLKAETSEGTGNTHISGVRGGSVLDEAVDYMFITGYKQLLPDSEERRPNDQLIIGLQHSRYGDGGAHKRQVVKLDPNSGLILNNGQGYEL